MKTEAYCRTPKDMSKESMKRIFVLAALALTLAACNKQDIQPVGQNDGMITLTATLAPKGAATKAITDNNDGKITATWVLGEKLAILYEVSGSPKKAEAEVKSVDASGAATIEFTVDSSTTDGTACTVIYPATAAKDDATDVKSNADLIDNQPGTLDPRLDVRVTTGSISPVNPAAGLVLNNPLAPKFSIVKFTLQDATSNPISAKSLAVTIGSDAFVATPASPASEFYLALPAVSDGTLFFSVPGDAGTNSYRSSKASLTIEAGKYYRSTVQMAVQSDDADYVPMGDGLNWALKNVGASSPENGGDYFAWGETEPYYSSQSPLTWKSGKSGYNWASYSWGNGAENKLTKYCGNASYGNDSYTDELKWLESADDAATKNLGATWRMPKLSEWQALLKAENFTWVRVTNFNGGGNNGHLVISKKSGSEGNCIFLPFAGLRNNTSLQYVSFGYYWSSSLWTNLPRSAYVLEFFSRDVRSIIGQTRSKGCSVRPVQTAE